ncbi:protein Wnt-4 [Hydra vulgaris]|uniref:protein Wnt-4 n=1 Tax=Hydra vulgaris TaxID=6087 RepID=UPI001F5F4FB0|nr:protein Wnt-4 [Hydra vulgaris]
MGFTIYLIILMEIRINYANIKWLGVDQFPSSSSWSQNNVCRKNFGFNGRQVSFCRSNFEWMSLTKASTADTKEECKDMLKDRRWNCQSVNKAPEYDDDLKKDTKESALLHSLAASSLALSIARGCMAGKLDKCSCFQTTRQFSFPSEMIDPRNLSNIDNMVGCKDITRVGVEFANLFMKLGFREKATNEIQEKSYTIRKHNIDLGLKELAQGEEIACICNGATAGCTTKYCHRRLKEYPVISKILLKKYDEAAFAKLKRLPVNDVKEDVKNTFQIPFSQSEKLLYLDEGPDQCKIVNGFHKSSRRQCVLDDAQPNSCSKLCCYGYREKVIEIISECNCKFVYCCRVECDKCKSMKKVYECV